MAPYWLTVVTAHLDDHQGLQKTLRSMAEQDSRGVEHLIIDGSEDPRATERLCRNYGSLCIQVIAQNPHGVYPAMNAGLNQAQGRFITFLNAGDSFHSPQVLSELNSFIKTHDPAWLYGNVQLVDSKGQKRLARQFDYERELKRNFRMGRYPQHQATYVQTQVLKDIGGFDVSLAISADYKVLLTLSKITNPAHWNYVAVDFLLGGVSSERWVSALWETYQARREIFTLSPLNRVWDLLLSSPVYARALASRALGRV